MGEYSYKRYDYQYGTEAPKYPQNPYSEPRERPDFTPLKRPKPQKRSKEEIIFMMKITGCGVLLFLGAFSFVHLTSTLARKQRALKLVNTEIRETQSAINSLQATIAANLNLEYIQQVAEEKLNMTEPLPHQVVYITTMQESYTLYNE